MKSPPVAQSEIHGGSHRRGRTPLAYMRRAIQSLVIIVVLGLASVDSSQAVAASNAVISVQYVGAQSRTEPAERAGMREIDRICPRYGHWSHTWNRRRTLVFERGKFCVRGHFGQYLIFQHDGNLVLYDRHPKRDFVEWATGTQHRGTGLALQSDGNIVVYYGRRARWASGTHERGLPARTTYRLTVSQTLFADSRGNGVVYDTVHLTKNGRKFWNSVRGRE